MNCPEYYRSILDFVDYPGYTFHLEVDGRGEMYLQATYFEEDIAHKDVKTMQSTRRWFVSPYMTKSEFVQTMFKCIVTSAEHRAREHFKYRGQRVYSPHFDVDALWRISVEKKHDYRDEL